MTTSSHHYSSEQLFLRFRRCAVFFLVEKTFQKGILVRKSQPEFPLDGALSTVVFGCGVWTSTTFDRGAPSFWIVSESGGGVEPAMRSPVKLYPGGAVACIGWEWSRPAPCLVPRCHCQTFCGRAFLPGIHRVLFLMRILTTWPFFCLHGSK